MIEVKNLVKRYNDSFLALDNLSFTAKEGQIIGFLGPNGAGKSTAMNIITGYISATEGTVIVNGHDIYEGPEEAKKSIGYLPEQPPLYQDMTVLEYLSFVADLKKVDKKEKKEMINDVMDMTQISDVSARLIQHLSKGYKQRVGLSQALIGYPPILVLDEPTVGLDPKQIIEIRQLIKSLSKEHTIILSSHVLSEISAVCDYVLIINKGKLIVSDEADNLSNHIDASKELKLEVKGSKEDIENALKDISNIINIEFTSLDNEDIVSLSIITNENDDVREDVFYSLSDAKCPIMSMNSSTMSLEEIFLEVTSKADDDQAEEDKENASNL
ncbi:MAG TPA: ABC transporter ATP-binding protein [Clostridiales bacterium]|nr:ABC transporter ATP-binding protein [Clostridiales bacterium]